MLLSHPSTSRAARLTKIIILSRRRDFWLKAVWKAESASRNSVWSLDANFLYVPHAAGRRPKIHTVIYLFRFSPEIFKQKGETSILHLYTVTVF